MKLDKIRHEFTDFVPEEVKEGVLYISIPYATATHMCACGCREIVVTPIGPTDWTLTWDGYTVTIQPSIGNWSLPCKSHYVIKKNRIIWGKKWSELEIKRGRVADRMAKDKYYGESQRQKTTDKDVKQSGGLIHRILMWFRRPTSDPP